MARVFEHGGPRTELHKASEIHNPDVMRYVLDDRNVVTDEEKGSLGQAELREARRDMQMVFQDPFASLNPLRRLRDQVAEPLINFGLASKPEIADRVAELFDRVDLPRSFLNRYPHELSGRPAATRCDCPRDRSSPEPRHSRRGRFRARRFGAGASAESARRIAGGSGVVVARTLGFFDC